MPCTGRIPCNGAVKGSLGVLFVLEDWQVRVFWLSGLVDRPSDRLCIHTIPLSGCMERRSRYRGNNQRRGSPCGLPDTDPSEDWRRTYKRRNHRPTPNGQCECGVCVIKPQRKQSQTPQYDNGKQGVLRTYMFNVCATAQPGQLPAYHGECPKPSTRN